MNTSKIHPLLVQLYGEELGSSVLGEVTALLDSYRDRLPKPQDRTLTRRDAVLIAYPDHIREADVPPLQTLAEFCSAHLAELVSTVHLLPFYPWSSDDGFSVVDYRSVDPRYGDWQDIARLARSFRLMFDAVINHVSVGSAWFQGALRGDPTYRGYFVVPREGADLSQVVRPRALPLLTEFQMDEGPRGVWTTFSPDQVDLNYENPRVLLEIIDVLLYYISRGAEFLRLDAIAYLWKLEGTPSIHLPQTHWIIQLFRAVLDETAPQVMLITETNVPHEENISYFGNGSNEAQLVYNFTLPPLVLHAFHRGSARTLSDWARTLKAPGRHATYFNFLASHDGIGVNPLRGILPESEIEAMAEKVAHSGGRVSMKSMPDGREIPYELNINYLDALNDAGEKEVSSAGLARFVCAHAILLALAGLPAIYMHSLLGSRGWPEGVSESGRSRTINREKLERAKLEAELADPSSRRARVFAEISGLLRARASAAAFDPWAAQDVLDAGDGVFGLLRRAGDGTAALCLHNVSKEAAQISIDRYLSEEKHVKVLAASAEISAAADIQLEPYQFAWLALTK